MSELGEAFEELLSVFDRLEIRFLVGGSVASATHAFPRFTQDIDIVADISTDSLDAFCDAIEPRFYVDRETVRRSVAGGRAFNIIHSRLAYKFDIFPAANNPFAQAELGRSRYATTRVTGLEGIAFPVASPEDIILSKLNWYRRGGESSQRQWNDILDVLQVCRPNLNMKYLNDWSVELGVNDLLAVALAQPHRPR